MEACALLWGISPPKPFQSQVPWPTGPKSAPRLVCQPGCPVQQMCTEDWPWATRSPGLYRGPGWGWGVSGLDRGLVWLMFVRLCSVEVSFYWFLRASGESLCLDAERGTAVLPSKTGRIFLKSLLKTQRLAFYNLIDFIFNTVYYCYGFICLFLYQ